MPATCCSSLRLASLLAPLYAARRSAMASASVASVERRCLSTASLAFNTLPLLSVTIRCDESVPN